MKKYLLSISILLFCYAFFSGAQPLPALPKASEIEAGTLPNGIAYYIISNPAAKGRTDYTLVQRGQKNLSQSRANLSRLPHFRNASPYRFFANNGSGYSADGYISADSDCTIYSFKDLNIAQEAVATDTLLTMIFDIAASQPYEQALVICGELNAKSFVEKVKMFSMMVTSRAEYLSKKPYVWSSVAESDAFARDNSLEQAASIEFMYASERTSKENMNTIQPLVTEKLVGEMGIVLQSAIESSFREKGIPLESVSFHHTPSSGTAGDEAFSLVVNTDESYLRAATSQVAAILSELDCRGTTTRDFNRAREGFRAVARRSQDALKTNADYTSQCINAWLYGGSLASEKSKYEFFLGKNLPAEKEKPLLDAFISALLDKTENLTIYYNVPGGKADESALLSTFNAAWDNARQTLWSDQGGAPAADSVRLAKSFAKARIKSEAEEPVLGGSVWTFANGIKVIYKKVPASGMFYYSYMLRGGAESPFMGDMLQLFGTSALDRRAFRDMLCSNGISMEGNVSLTGLQIRGSAPSGKLSLLLKSIHALSDKPVLEEKDFDEYRKSEALRLEISDRSVYGSRADMDKAVRLSDYSKFKYSTGLESLTYGDVLKYYTDRLSNLSDGVLVLVGDLDPLSAQKVLSSYLGSFPVSGRYAARPQVKTQFRSGIQSLKGLASYSGRTGGRKGVEMYLTALSPVSAERFFAVKVAEEAVRGELVKSLADKGCSVEVSTETDLFPSDRISVWISCLQADRNGLPEGVVPAAPAELSEVIGSVLERLSETALPDNVFKQYRTLVAKSIDFGMSRPDGMIDALLLRYSEGKDFMAGYKAKLDAVKPEMVKEVLSSLSDGGRVDYFFE